MANVGRRRISHDQSTNMGLRLVGTLARTELVKGKGHEEANFQRAKSRAVSVQQAGRAKMAPKSLRSNPKKWKARLQALIKRLEAQEHVQNRDIKVVLTPAQWKDCKAALKDAEPAVMPCPVELNDYFKLVRTADFQHVKNSTTAEGYYEHAQERLGEILGSCSAPQRSAMEYWLDRPVEYDPETGKIDIGLDPTSVPRKRGSRSQHAMKAAANTQTAWDQIREIKLGHLNMALDSLQKPKQAIGLSKNEMAKLDELRKLVRR